MRLMLLCLLGVTLAGYLAFTDVRMYQHRQQILQLQQHVDGNTKALKKHVERSNQSFEIITAFMNKVVVRLREKK